MATAAMIQPVKRQSPFSVDRVRGCLLQPVQKSLALAERGLVRWKKPAGDILQYAHARRARVLGRASLALAERGLVWRKKSAGDILQYAHAVEREFQVEQDSLALLGLHKIARNISEHSSEAPQECHEEQGKMVLANCGWREYVYKPCIMFPYATASAKGLHRIRSVQRSGCI